MIEHKSIFPEELVKAVGDSVGSVYYPPVLAGGEQSLYGLDGVLSTIYLKGDIIGKAWIFIRCSGAAKVVANMLGAVEIDEDSTDVLDGIGEVLNILVGRFKQHLEPHRIRVEISVPSTRVTSIVLPGRWENNIERVFTANDVSFNVGLSYRLVQKEEKPAAPPPSAQAKMKLSAADLLKQILAKKK